MPKNIIVCADGTGNKGGTTPDSNVYKIYKAIDKRFRGATQKGFEIDEQILFYDNGVGTTKNKYLRMIGGAFGYGFEDNVCDLYKFLARNYNPGDRIYFFGFSRGASTVRACNGFISTCGLAKGKGLHNWELDALVQEAFEAYKSHKITLEKAVELKESESSHGVIDIHFIGIWDTVVALGFPKRTDTTDPVSVALNGLFWLAEKGLDVCWPHSFYEYSLTENVQYAYQALAIDDERTAFWPFVLRENNREADTVEQVWFAGMHSNVGGGYGRSGMASVPLHWMMLRAVECGIILDDDALQRAFEDSNIHGRMYNSRDGFAMFYRYHPREIEKLCAGHLQQDIRIHSSVIERIAHRTANYAPGQLPEKFVVVDSDLKAPAQVMNPAENPDWSLIRKEINTWVLWRKRLYSVMLTFSMAILFAAVWFWNFPPAGATREGGWGYMADALDYALPDAFDGLIDYAVAQHYFLFIGACLAVYGYMKIRGWCLRKTVVACERLRHLIIREVIPENR